MSRVEVDAINASHGVGAVNSRVLNRDHVPAMMLIRDQDPALHVGSVIMQINCSLSWSPSSKTSLSKNLIW